MGVVKYIIMLSAVVGFSNSNSNAHDFDSRNIQPCLQEAFEYTKSYLKADFDKLKECASPVAGVTHSVANLPIRVLVPTPSVGPGTFMCADQRFVDQLRIQFPDIQLNDLSQIDGDNSSNPESLLLPRIINPSTLPTAGDLMQILQGNQSTINVSPN